MPIIKIKNVHGSHRFNADTLEVNKEAVHYTLRGNVTYTLGDAEAEMPDKIDHIKEWRIDDEAYRQAGFAAITRVGGDPNTVDIRFA